MMRPLDEAEQTITTILKEFDFIKAHRALRGCGWKYEGSASTPSIPGLKKTAESILRHAMQSGSGCTVKQGPLLVTVDHYDTPAVVTVTLSLVPIRTSQVYIDERAML